MTQRGALLAAALLLGAASPRSFVPLASTDPLSPPPAVTAPKAASFSAFSPAPVPDIDQEDGTARKSGPQRMQLTPSFFKPREGPSGDGFTPNSTVYGEQTKRLLPTPGLNLNVPLQ